MKRHTKGLPRNKPMVHSGYLRRTGRLPAVSKARLQEAPARKQIREAVFERDGGCLAAGIEGLGACYGPPTFHHILKASQGGEYSMANGATICCHHNNLFESSADAAAIAKAVGLVRTRSAAAGPPPSAAVGIPQEGAHGLLGELRDDVASGEVWPDDAD